MRGWGYCRENQRHYHEGRPGRAPPSCSLLLTSDLAKPVSILRQEQFRKFPTLKVPATIPFPQRHCWAKLKKGDPKMTLILIILLVLLLGGGGGYYGHSRWGYGGGAGVGLGTMLLILLVVWLAGGFN